MSNKYGLKEVADVMFVRLKPDTTTALGTAEKQITAYLNSTENGIDFYINDKKVIGPTEALPTGSTEDDVVRAAFLFDTLKTSNIEVASEETSAKGGKGNPELISWSYGKTATITVTDALLSMDTLALLFGAVEYKDGSVAGDTVLTIDGNTFPDSYAILGTTVLRPFAGGDDEPFAFIVPKAKINVGGTLTMEAEGDPSTFEMSIKALSARLHTATVVQGTTPTDTMEKDVLLKFVKPTAKHS